jgi:hypothetical protein
VTYDGLVSAPRIALVFLGLLFAACSPSAVLSPSPSTDPTVAPTPSAVSTPSPTSTPLPTPSPSAPPAVDAAAGLKIAAPYTLAPLDPTLEAAFRQQFSTSMGALAGLIGFGGRDIVQNGAPVGHAFVISLPAGVLTQTTYESLLQGIEGSGQMIFTTTTIAGTEVSSGTAATGALGIYRDGDRIVMVSTPAADTFTPVTKALITAN